MSRFIYAIYISMLRYIYPRSDLYIHAQIYIYMLRFIYPCSNIYIRAQIYTYMLRFICTCSDLYIHAQIYLSISRFIFPCSDLYIHVHMHIYIYIYEKIALLPSCLYSCQVRLHTALRYDCYVAILQHPACSELIWLLPCCAHVCVGMQGVTFNVDSLSRRIESLIKTGPLHISPVVHAGCPCTGM